MFLYLEESGDPNIGVCLQEVLQLELKVRKTQRYIRPFFAIASKIMSVKFVLNTYTRSLFRGTVKLGNKERFDKEQIGIKEPFPVTNLPFTS